jgi:hypothetical protein
MTVEHEARKRIADILSASALSAHIGEKGSR